MTITAREISVKALIESGHTTAEIAAELGLSRLSVNKVRSRINRKIGVVSREKMLAQNKAARALMLTGETTDALRERFERNARIIGYMGAASADTKAAYRSYPKHPDAVLDLLCKASESLGRAIQELRKT